MKILKNWFLLGGNIYSEQKASVFLFKSQKAFIDLFLKNRRRILKNIYRLFPEMESIKYAWYRDGEIKNHKAYDEKSPLSAAVLCLTVALLKRNRIESKVNVIHRVEIKRRRLVYLIIECPYKRALRRTYYYALASAIKIFRDVAYGRKPNLEKKSIEFQNMFIRERLTPKASLIINDAVKKGIPYIHIAGKNLFQLGMGANQVRLDSSNINDMPASKIAEGKQFFKELFKTVGSMTPPGDKVKNYREAKELAARIGYPVVTKPCRGSLGFGVTTNIRTEKELIRAFDRAKKDRSGVLLEKYFIGRDYRVTLVDYKVVAAVERVPAKVVGNGKHTIKELIKIENEENPARGDSPQAPLKKIDTNVNTIKVLKRQKHNYSSVPKKGETVYVRDTANISTGGESIDVTSKVHPKMATILSFAARLAGLKVTGIDILCPDISKDMKNDEWTIIEMNGRPDIDMHHHPYKGKKRDVAGLIVNMLFPDGKYRIPVFAITGTNGKTTTSRMIAYILQGLGRTIGLTTTGNVSIGETQIYKVGSGSNSARALLLDPMVHLGVFEVTHLGILTSGLGYEKSDIGIITNIREDHIGERVKDMGHPEVLQNVSDLFRVKSVVARNIRDDGALILNADDPLCVRMQKYTKAKVIFFSLKENNPVLKKHLNKGGMVYFVRNGVIIRKSIDKETNIIQVDKMPAAEKGIAKHNILNAMGAIAATLAIREYRVTLKNIREALSSFESSYVLNPGRMNVVELPHAKVIMDFAHNPEGYETIFEAVSHIPAKRKVGVIKAAGDRPDSIIIDLGRLAGDFFDKIYIKDPAPEKIRGRKKAEVAGLLKKGALKAGLDENKIKIVLDEVECVKAALNDLKKGDLILVFVHNIDEVHRVLMSHKRKLEYLKNK